MAEITPFANYHFAGHPGIPRATAFDLITRAERAKLLERDLGSYGRSLFSYRNRVNHDNAEPE
jgi:hypothetical protein